MQLIWIPQWDSVEQCYCDLWINPEHIESVEYVFRKNDWENVRSTIVMHGSREIDTPIPINELVPYLVNHHSMSIYAPFAQYCEHK